MDNKKIRSPINRGATTLLLLFVTCSSIFAQFEQYNHPELEWRTLETEHAIVHFHQGADRTARELTAIAEQVYEPITSLYNYYPDTKVHWIVKDTDDYSNGGAYYYDNKIVIWATPLDFELRGTHQWLYDVVTHEFTHLIQLGASRKGPRWMPGIYFQYIGYEAERRPDVLYGFPNRIASWPTTSTQIPMWFAEGTAQYQTKGLGHDWWDSHRDMMIRVRALGGNLLTSTEMDVFGKSTMGSELVYCQGYALTRYIAGRYGQETLAKLSQTMGSPYSWDFDHACQKVLDRSEEQLYREWRSSIEADYRTRTETIRANLVEGRVIQDDGFGNLHPVFAPDGKSVAFISNKGRDFLSTADLYFYDMENDSLIKTECPAKGPFNWSPDGKNLVYARQDDPNRKGSHFDDLYLWDIEKKEELRLTRDSRLSAPSFSPDGRRLVAVHTTDGSQNLSIVELPDSIWKLKDVIASVSYRNVTKFQDGRQIFKPRFSPDGKSIIGSTSDLSTRDIFEFNIESERWSLLIASPYDERDPVYSVDGKWLYYAEDHTGIYNLFRHDTENGQVEAVSNVTGGSFMPSVSHTGMIAYTQFTEKGYGIRLIDSVRAVSPDMMTYVGGEHREDVKLPDPPRYDGDATRYNTPFGKLFILPRVAWDYSRFKPGFYAYTNDFLDKLSLFGGGQVNSEGDRDLYGSIEYRVMKPTISLEAYNIVRNKSERFDDPFVIVGERIVDGKAVPIFGTYNVDYRFDLTEFDLGARLPIDDQMTATGTIRLSTYKSALRFDDGSNFDYTYLRGKAYLLKIDGNWLTRSAGSDIHPLGGYEGWIEYARENNRFIEGFEIDADKLTLLEVYKPYNYDRIEAEGDYYHKVWRKLVINTRVSAGVISRSVDPFFHLYAGGLQGLRGYSYYSLGGTRKAMGRLNLRFPIASHIDMAWGPFYLDRIHGALFAEAGDSWKSGIENARLRKDVGAELRVKMFSWYGFPTDISLAAAYGLDKFTVHENDVFQSYGKEWRWYFTLLFDYL